MTGVQAICAWLCATHFSFLNRAARPKSRGRAGWCSHRLMATLFSATRYFVFNGSAVVLASYALYYLTLEPFAGLTWAAFVGLPLYVAANAAYQVVFYHRKNGSYVRLPVGAKCRILQSK
jgi:hypothetical protein